MDPRDSGRVGGGVVIAHVGSFPVEEMLLVGLSSGVAGLAVYLQARFGGFRFGRRRQ